MSFQTNQNPLILNTHSITFLVLYTTALLSTSVNKIEFKDIVSLDIRKMGKKERVIKARIAEYYKEYNQFDGHQEQQKLSEDDMKIIDHMTEEDKLLEKIVNVVHYTKTGLIDYTDNNALHLCEFLDDVNLENFVRFTLQSVERKNPSTNLVTVTERPIKPVKSFWSGPRPFRELSSKNKKRFGTWENFTKYWENFHREESRKKSDAITIIIRSIIIPQALRIKLEWPKRMEKKRKEEEKKRKEEERKNLKKWEDDDAHTLIIATQNARKAQRAAIVVVNNDNDNKKRWLSLPREYLKT